VYVSVNNRACNLTGSTGRFVVHEVEYDTSNRVSKLAADVEQRCGTGGSPLIVELRLNSAVPMSVLTDGACGRDTDGDGIDDCLEWDQQRNPLARDNDIFADARLFAREGDTAGIDYWAGQLNGNLVSRGTAIEQFLNSPEFGGVMAPVARLYLAYFKRVPDKAGLDFWVGYRRAGNPMESISNAFAQSAEFASTYGTLSNSAFVDRVYRNVLDRAPEPEGLAFWKQQLDNGTRTRGQVMLAFSESQEYVSLTTNDIFVTMTYMGMLQRAPDAAGYAYWVSYMDAGNSGQALINSFLGASEYRLRFLP
jgi:hypothetical protein